MWLVKEIKQNHNDTKKYRKTHSKTQNSVLIANPKIMIVMIAGQRNG